MDFNGTNGSSPFSSAILSDNDSMLYGMTNGGGIYEGGVIYSIKTDGTNYSVLHSFTPGGTSGVNPYGSLIRQGNILYGMTNGGGQYSSGTIFTIKTDGTGYLILHHFNKSANNGGGKPYGTLSLLGNKLFGMTNEGGAYNKGVVFSINSDGQPI